MNKHMLQITLMIVIGSFLVTPSARAAFTASVYLNVESEGTFAESTISSRSTASEAVFFLGVANTARMWE